MPHSLLLALSLLLAACAAKESALSVPADPAVIVTYQVAEPIAMPLQMETIAQTEGAKEVNIRPRVGGVLLRRLYTEGDTVKAGQALFLIDPESFRHALTEANALLREQQVRVLRAQMEENRQRQLLAENFVSQRAYDIVRADLAAAEAGMQAAKARVKQAELNLSYTTVTAPFSGVTGRAEFSEGALVSANDSVLTTLSQLSPIWVQFSFSGNDLEQANGRLTEHNVHSVKIILPDGSEYSQQGRINFAASQIDAQLGTQRLRATFENSDQQVLPGQFVRIRITAGESRRVFLVPQPAVLTSEFGRYVYLAGADNTVVQRPVTVGEWIGKDWIILEGLQAGDKVVIDNLIKLTPGKAINPQPAQPPASPDAVDEQS